jgi:hypothetical protein
LQLIAQFVVAQVMLAAVAVFPVRFGGVVGHQRLVEPIELVVIVVEDLLPVRRKMDHDNVILPGGGNQRIQRPGDAGFGGPPVGQYRDVLGRETPCRVSTSRISRTSLPALVDRQPPAAGYLPTATIRATFRAPAAPCAAATSPGGGSSQPASSRPRA